MNRENTDNGDEKYANKWISKKAVETRKMDKDQLKNIIF